MPESVSCDLNKLNTNTRDINLKHCLFSLEIIYLYVEFENRLSISEHNMVKASQMVLKTWFSRDNQSQLESLSEEIEAARVSQLHRQNQLTLETSR